MKAAVGREPISGLYWEILGSGTAHPVPLLFIHGGGGSGDIWRATPDGQAGWADLLAARGHRCWVTDWPGSGRSARRDLLALRYADVVEGYLALLRDVIGEPVVVLPHSMGGPTTWKLIEQAPDLVAGVIGIAAGYPGNLAATNSKVLSDDGTVITFTFGDTGVPFRIDRSVPYVLEDTYITKQAIGTSKLFPTDSAAQVKAGLTPMSPLMILERAGVMEGMPVITRPDGFKGKKIRLMAGSEDPAHTLDIEQKTASLLRSWGANSEVVWLPDRGIAGNGHMLPMERNHLQILDVIVEELREISR